MNLRMFRLIETSGENYTYLVRAWTGEEAIYNLKKTRIKNLVADGDYELGMIRQILDQEYSVEDVSDESIFYLDRD